jgi:hypothetical protein
MDKNPRSRRGFFYASQSGNERYLLEGAPALLGATYFASSMNREMPANGKSGFIGWGKWEAQDAVNTFTVDWIRCHPSDDAGDFTNLVLIFL